MKWRYLFITHDGFLNIINIIGLVVMLLILTFGVFVYTAPHFGWQVNGLRTDSMSPVLVRGTFVVAKPVEPKEIAVNDIIIYRPMAGNSLICHRVIEIGNSPLKFRAKGDALPVSDPGWIPSNSVVGKVVFSMPVVGFAAMFMKTTTGYLISIGVPGLFIIVICLRNIKQELPANGKKR